MTRNTGVSVAIVGGCQAQGLKQWLSALLPDSRIAAWHVNAAAAGAPEEIEKHLPRFDLVITQIANGSDTPTLELEALKERSYNALYLPLFVFPGFHPDITPCGVIKPTPHFVRGPLEQLQSTIIIAAYQLGLPAARVPRLFNSLVFDELGYLDSFAESRIAATAIYAEHGYDIAGSFDEWLRDGVFMYTNNHPHIRVLGTLAQLALKKAGIDHRPLSDVPAPVDDLANSVRWPTHKPIAKQVGVAEEPLYGRIAAAARKGQERWLAPAAFVNATYAGFSDLAPSDFINNDAMTNAVDGLRNLLQTAS